MAELYFSLADLFEKTFGYKTQAFDPEFAPVQGDKATLRSEQGAQGSPYYAKDSLGTEYYMPVTLTYPDVTPLATPGMPFAEGDNSFTKLKKWNLPYPVISIPSRKTIIETPLTERRG